MKYSVAGKKVVHKFFECFADTPHKAVEMFKAENPEFEPTGIDELTEDETNADGWEVLGECTGCSAVLLDVDDHATDDDGNRFCNKCIESA